MTLGKAVKIAKATSIRMIKGSCKAILKNRTLVSNSTEGGER